MCYLQLNVNNKESRGSCCGQRGLDLRMCQDSMYFLTKVRFAAEGVREFQALFSPSPPTFHCVIYVTGAYLPFLPAMRAMGR